MQRHAGGGTLGGSANQTSFKIKPRGGGGFGKGFGKRRTPLRFTLTRCASQTLLEGTDIIKQTHRTHGATEREGIPGDTPAPGCLQLPTRRAQRPRPGEGSRPRPQGHCQGLPFLSTAPGASFLGWETPRGAAASSLGREKTSQRLWPWEREFVPHPLPRLESPPHLPPARQEPKPPGATGLSNLWR